MLATGASAAAVAGEAGEAMLRVRVLNGVMVFILGGDGDGGTYVAGMVSRRTGDVGLRLVMLVITPDMSRERQRVVGPQLERVLAIFRCVSLRVGCVVTQQKAAAAEFRSRAHVVSK